MPKSGDLKFILAGERLVGSWVLVRIKKNEGRDTRNRRKLHARNISLTPTDCLRNPRV
jgi:hypothetical protein